MSEYIEIDGVAWCIAHQGVVDECADYVDDEGEPCCDQYDGPQLPCDIRVVYYRAVSS